MRSRTLAILAAALVGGSSLGYGDADSVAAIHAIGLRRADGATLTGGSAYIGQVEVARTAIRGFDSDSASHGSVVPFESRIENGHIPSPDQFVGSHPIEVAGVMIGGAGAPRSVAPGAVLYSTGYVTSSNDGQLISTQYIAKRYAFSDPRHIRVINHSWGAIRFLALLMGIQDSP